jgi:hypothetical protein
MSGYDCLEMRGQIFLEAMMSLSLWTSLFLGLCVWSDTYRRSLDGHAQALKQAYEHPGLTQRGPARGRDILVVWDLDDPRWRAN